jgi:hypothetical protein
MMARAQQAMDDWLEVAASDSTRALDAARGGAMNWDLRFDAVAQAAWETWTKIGLNMNRNARDETMRTVYDAATNVWIDGMSDAQWVAATLKRLRS